MIEATRAILVRRSARFLLPDIRLERSECTARTGSPLSTSYLGDAGIKISGYGKYETKGARTYDRACQDVRLRPSDAAPRFAGGWWDVGNAHAAVSESEVICDFRCGLKAKGNAPVRFRFEGVRNTPIWPPPVTSLATGADTSGSAQAAKQYYGIDLDWGPRSLMSQTLESRVR
jgi:hypothetical protein